MYTYIWSFRIRIINSDRTPMIDWESSLTSRCQTENLIKLIKRDYLTILKWYVIGLMQHISMLLHVYIIFENNGDEWRFPQHLFSWPHMFGLVVEMQVPTHWRYCWRCHPYNAVPGLINVTENNFSHMRNRIHDLSTNRLAHKEYLHI